MADSTRKRSSSKARPSEEEQAEHVEQAETASVESQPAAPPEGTETEGAQDAPEVPAANDPDPAAPPATDGGADTGEQEYAHSVLIANPQLMEATPELIRGVLASAPDPISLADARARIDSFRTTPLPTSTPEEA